MKGIGFFSRHGGAMLWCYLGLLVLSVLTAEWLIRATIKDLRPFQTTLRPQALEVRKQQFLDRNGVALSVTYDNPWNVGDWLALHEIPTILQEAFTASEDRRFYRHHGVDWLARGHALLQNIAALRGVRGASTITEQVVRILHPRPRTLWSRWLEGIEAVRLENRFSKTEILEFYLNEVPYARQRRGVLQAARLYFDRDLDTLNTRETLTLAVLIRAPGRFDLQQGKGDLDKPLRRLAKVLVQSKKLSGPSYDELVHSDLSLDHFHLPVDAGHFVQHISRFESPAAKEKIAGPARIVTTLDSGVQEKIQEILDQHLRDLKDLDVSNGAVLVVNHQTDEILAWVNGGGLSGEVPGGWIDAITSPRQPGSALKPFLYALALDMGWTPSTIIEDSPLARPIGNGMHPFHNYSRKFYGPLRLRETLGNSLNIPAIRTIQFTGMEVFLDRLHGLGFASLRQNASYYGEGLALGNGEVTLFELVQAYTALARVGIFRPLRFTFDDTGRHGATMKRIYSSEAASLVADILSDPQARRLEFGTGNILRLPVQTAVKTGTSNDHRDAWAVGFNHRYTVGIWMGNLDRHATDGLTSTTGPGLILRSVFAELNRFEEARPLYLSPRLAVVKICRETGLRAIAFCPSVLEKYMPGTLPSTFCSHHAGAGSEAQRAVGSEKETSGMTVRLLQPTPNLQMAMDPRIPDNIEAYPLKIAGQVAAKRIEWLVDGKIAGITRDNASHFMWPLARGTHQACARVWQAKGGNPLETPAVQFFVK